MLQTKDKEALLKFLKDWAKPMQVIFDERFGKSKIAHIIIALDVGNEPTVSFVSNLRDSDFKRCLKLLAEKVNETRIIH